MDRVWSAGICVALLLLAAPASNAQKARASTHIAAVEVSAPRVQHGLEEFEARRAMGIGRFLRQNQIDSASTTDFNTFMATSFPGLTVIFLANGEHVLGSTRSSCDADFTRLGLPQESTGRTVANCAPNKPCPVPVILDGQDVHEAVSDAIHLRDLAAAEYYTATQVPMQYRVSGYGCVVLVLWTRRN